MRSHQAGTEKGKTLNNKILPANDLQANKRLISAKGKIPQVPQVKRFREAKNAARMAQGAFFSPGLQRRKTFYVYVELLSQSESNRATRKVKKVETITRTYRTASSSTETQERADRARDKALEAAIETACDYLYRLETENTPVSRFFVSELGDTAKAKQDTCTLEYFRIVQKKETQSRLSDTLLRACTLK